MRSPCRPRRWRRPGSCRPPSTARPARASRWRAASSRRGARPTRRRPPRRSRSPGSTRTGRSSCSPMRRRPSRISSSSTSASRADGGRRRTPPVAAWPRRRRPRAVRSGPSGPGFRRPEQRLVRFGAILLGLAAVSAIFFELVAALSAARRGLVRDHAADRCLLCRPTSTAPRRIRRAAASTRSS